MNRIKPNSKTLSRFNGLQNIIYMRMCQGVCEIHALGLGTICIQHFVEHYQSLSNYPNASGRGRDASYLMSTTVRTVGDARVWGLKDPWLEAHHPKSHCNVSLSKTLYPLLSTDSTQEDRKPS